MMRVTSSIQLLVICTAIIKGSANEESRSTETQRTIGVTRMSSIPTKMHGVNIDVPLRGKSIRSGSLELPLLGAQGVDSDKLHTTDDNFADLEGYISPESLKLIRRIHGRKTPVTRVPRYETTSSPSNAHRPERGSTPSEVIHLSGKIEIL